MFRKPRRKILNFSNEDEVEKIPGGGNKILVTQFSKERRMIRRRSRPSQGDEEWWKREIGKASISHVKEILHFVLATRMDEREFLKWMIDTGEKGPPSCTFRFAKRILGPNCSSPGEREAETNRSFWVVRFIGGVFQMWEIQTLSGKSGFLRNVFENTKRENTSPENLQRRKRKNDLQQF